MKIDLYVNRTELETVELTNRQTAIVIDVLRASTSIITALYNGCRAVIPVIEVEDAFLLAEQFSREDRLLAGERQEVFIAGFDLSNSPLEFTADRVKDKTIIFTSTNGARLFRVSAAARQTVVCGFVNVSRVVDFVRKSSAEVAILCAGKHGQFGLEDVVCGGMVIAKLMVAEENNNELNDGALAAYRVYQHFAENLLGMLRQCSHGRRLVQIGQDCDLIQAASVDLLPILPVVKDGQIVSR